MFTKEFLDKVEASKTTHACVYCGKTDRLTEMSLVDTGCDGVYVQVRQCTDIHACCRRINGGPLPGDSDYTGRSK